MPLYLPRPEPVDLSVHCNADFREAHIAREKWLAIIETGGFDKESFNDYFKEWKVVEKRAWEDPWEEDEANPFGFAWTDISFHKRLVYVKSAHFETLNLLAVRAVRLLAAENDDVKEAAELESVAKEAFDVLSRWKNMPTQLGDRYAACARDFWATVIQIVSATRLLNAVKNDTEFNIETFYQVRDAPSPTFSARHPALIELFIIRDDRNGMARIQMLQKVVELLSKKSSTLSAAVLAARERTALSKLVYLKDTHDGEVEKTKTSWFWNTQSSEEDEVHPVVRECIETQIRVEYYAKSLHVLIDSHDFSWSRLSNIIEKFVKL